jgi:hypothetical protein
MGSRNHGAPDFGGLWHVDEMQSAQGGSWRSTFRRPGASTALMLVAAVGTLAIGGVGCTRRGWRPQPATVGEASPPAERPQPYVLLRLGERRLYLVDEAAGGLPEAFPVAIGRKQYQTPTGRFRINEMIMNPDFLRFDWNDPSRVLGRIPPGPTNPLGLRWIGFAHAHGWSIGFHGTHETDVLGQAVSHGCVRMRNSDVVKLYDRVEIGTTVVVEP